ncbi:putative immunity protein [Candidatus Bipolaricaulota bacterium]
MRLGKADHRSWVLWATDCAERVLPCFETQNPNDNRPREAIAAGRAWVRGHISCGEARAAARAAARDAADDPAARASARAAGHAAATAHVVGHARHAAAYAVKAAHAMDTTDGDAAATKEREWQVRRLPDHLRSVV